MLRTVDDFLSENKKFPKSEYLFVPGFEHFYARKGPKYIEGIKYENVFTIANVEATVKGKGIFTEFLAFFKKRYSMPIVVECVHNQRFAQWLLVQGFHADSRHPGNFNLIP